LPLKSLQQSADSSGDWKKYDVYLGNFLGSSNVTIPPQV
jgi:hypothetical protein